MIQYLGLWRIDTTTAIDFACELHQQLFPGKRIDRRSKRIKAILRLIDQAYSRGVDDGEKWVTSSQLQSPNDRSAQ